MAPKRSRSADTQKSPKKIKHEGKVTMKPQQGKASSVPKAVPQKGKKQHKPNKGEPGSGPSKTKQTKNKISHKKSTDVKSGPSGKSWLSDLLTDSEWTNKLTPSFQKESFKQMETWLNDEYRKTEVFPPKELIFNAFNITKFNQVKVVILGQDPYHDNGQAHGMSFSVPKGIAIPPSLKNIYKELQKDCPGFVGPDHGCLESWAAQGVLLLNAALTVRAHEPNSHARCGWWKFTDDVIRTISDHGNHTVFLLWGGFAHKKEALIDKNKHSIIKTAHPSPLSFNKFNGCKCFSQVNEALVKHGQTPVDWKIK